MCNAGYTGSIGEDSGQCEACDAGTYKDAAGSASCINCSPDSIPAGDHYLIDFIYAPDTVNSDTVNKFMEFDSALVNLDEYRTIAESFKILQFSNFGFDVDNAQDHTYSTTIEIKQQNGDLVDAVTLEFIIYTTSHAGTTQFWRDQLRVHPGLRGCAELRER